MKTGLTLYTDGFWISPYVFTCFVALREKGVPFETRLVALQEGQQRRPEFRDPSITGRVPALEHDGFWLAESSAIVEYLEDILPAPEFPALLPTDARERARARQILAWIRSDLLALREDRSTHTMFYGRSTTALSPAGQEAANKLQHVADLLITDGAPTLFTAWSIVDADLSFMLHRLILNGNDIKPKVREYAEAQWQRPSIREFVERERPAYVPY